jgi:ADP-ribose 1''-phosphate phosphatase
MLTARTDACNCLGAWGSGIAVQLREQFPTAYRMYGNHCSTNSPEDLLGTCLLIPPQPIDYEPAKSSTEGTTGKAKKPVWIACLFTSVGWGKPKPKQGNPGVASKEDVLKATAPALVAMMVEWTNARAGRYAEDEDEDDEEEVPDSAIFCPKFNSGAFGVPWERTEELIRQKWRYMPAKWTVVSP